MEFTVKFIIGIAVGWFLFHPAKEDSKFDQAVFKGVRKGGEKAVGYLTEKFDKAMTS